MSREDGDDLNAEQPGKRNRVERSLNSLSLCVR